MNWSKTMPKKQNPEYTVRYTFVDAWPIYAPHVSPIFTVYEVRELSEADSNGGGLRSVLKVVPIGKTRYLDEVPAEIAAIARAYMQLEAALISYVRKQEKRAKK